MDSQSLWILSGLGLSLCVAGGGCLLMQAHKDFYLWVRELCFLALLLVGLGCGILGWAHSSHLAIVPLQTVTGTIVAAEMDPPTYGRWGLKHSLNVCHMVITDSSGLRMLDDLRPSCAFQTGQRARILYQSVNGNLVSATLLTDDGRTQWSYKEGLSWPSSHWSTASVICLFLALTVILPKRADQP